MCAKRWKRERKEEKEEEEELTLNEYETTIKLLPCSDMGNETHDGEELCAGEGIVVVRRYGA